MIGLLQRVSHASVAVGGDTIGEIGRGLMVLVAVHRDDTEKDVQRLAERQCAVLDAVVFVNFQVALAT